MAEEDDVDAVVGALEVVDVVAVRLDVTFAAGDVDVVAVRLDVMVAASDVVAIEVMLVFVPAPVSVIDDTGVEVDVL